MDKTKSEKLERLEKSKLDQEDAFNEYSRSHSGTRHTWRQLRPISTVDNFARHSA